MKKMQRNAAHRIHLTILILALVLSVSVTSSCSVFSLLKRAAGSEGVSDTADTTESSQKSVGASEDSSDIETLKSVDFSMFSDYVTADTVSLHFSVSDPEALGLTVPAVTLGDVSEKQQAETIDKAQKYLGRLSGIDYDQLPREYRVMYDVLEYDLQETLAYKDYYYYSSPFNSVTGLQTELPLVLSEYTFSDKADVDDYLLLLQDMYRYYGDIMDFEDERAAQGLGASDENIQKIIDSCNSFLADKENHFLVSSFAARLNDVSGLDDAEKQEYTAKNQEMLDQYVFPAYQLLIDRFTALMGTGTHDGGLSSLPGGKDYYTLYLKTETSSDSSVSEVKAQIEDELSARIDIITGTDVNSDFEAAYNSYNFSMGTVQENLDYCEKAIEDDFPAIPAHKVTLQNVPSQLADYFSPAAYLSCRIDDSTDNVIITNTTALEGYQNLLGTIAHEGYPGHMYEAIYHAQTISGYYQRSASFIGYSEGWAENAASYILENSEYDQTLVSYVEAEDEVFNMLFPSRIDIGVNYDGWSREDVYDYLADYNITSHEYGDYCYDMAVEIPCYYMPYCIGHLNTSKILTDAADEAGNSASQKDINEAYLNIGPAPFPIIEKYINDYLQNG